MTDAAENPSSRLGPGLVVCLGASAGGLVPLEAFFAASRADNGFAYVVVSHASQAETLLPEILGRRTSMVVTHAESGAELRGGTVLVVTSRGGAIRNGTYAEEPPLAGTAPHPIDGVMRSLAKDCGARVVGVVLSGSGTDGTLGVQAIRDAGGLTLAQDLGSAEFASMPASAIATGAVDATLPAEQMPQVIEAFAGTSASTELDDAVVGRILAAVRGASGHDFRGYKSGTVTRRIQRRMGVCHAADGAAYLEYLRTHPEEANALFRDFLVGVTSFFRDPEAYQALREQALPQLIRRLESGQTLRAWVVACATGEEAYSIAMVIAELLAETKQRVAVQIFATDLDAHAIDVARAGLYPLGIAADVGAERLERFFVKDGDHYRIKREIREMVTFATHNVIADPPFTRVDLVACRNLLIYFDAALQQIVLPTLHYALNPGGILFLGGAETLGNLADGFDPVDRRWNVYRRKAQVGGQRVVPLRLHPSVPIASARGRPSATPPRPTLAEVVNRLLVDALVPPAVVVDAQGEIIHVHGRTDPFLEVAPGEPGMNVARMARGGLAAEVVAALRMASAGTPVLRRGLRVLGSDGRERSLDLEVKALEGHGGPAPLFVVCFEPPRDPDATVQVGGERTRELERELVLAHEAVRAGAEQYAGANEELRASNEELQSANEELQSTNEELETVKEEQQSLNEELQTVNAELRDKIAHLSQTHDDMRNLLNSTGIATLFLDATFRIKRFTPAASRIVSLIPSDVGRPISDLVSEVDYASILDEAREVLRTAASRDCEVHTASGTWYQVTISPYRTANDTVDGVVLAFVDVTRQKEGDASRVRERAAVPRVVRASPSPMLLVDAAKRIEVANAGASKLLGRPTAELEGRLLAELGGAWSDPRLEAALTHHADLQLAIQRDDADTVLHVTWLDDGTERTLIAVTPLAERNGVR